MQELYLNYNSIGPDGAKELAAYLAVTASLTVDYLRPTPLGGELEIRARATEVGARKVVVESELLAEGQPCARGRALAVKMPDAMIEELRRRRG